MKVERTKADSSNQEFFIFLSALFPWRACSSDRLSWMSEDACGPAQPVVLAQRFAGIVVAEQATLTQDRYDLLGEDVEAARQPGRHHVEAVGRAILEPGLDVIRDLFRRSGDHPMAARARQPLYELPDRRLLAVDDV